MHHIKYHSIENKQQIFEYTYFRTYLRPVIFVETSCKIPLPQNMHKHEPKSCTFLPCSRDSETGSTKFESLNYLKIISESAYLDDRTIYRRTQKIMRNSGTETRVRISGIPNFRSRRNFHNGVCQIPRNFSLKHYHNEATYSFLFLCRGLTNGGKRGVGSFLPEDQSSLASGNMEFVSLSLFLELRSDSGSLWGMMKRLAKHRNIH